MLTIEIKERGDTVYFNCKEVEFKYAAKGRLMDVVEQGYEFLEDKLHEHNIPKTELHIEIVDLGLDITLFYKNTLAVGFFNCQELYWKLDFKVNKKPFTIVSRNRSHIIDKFVEYVDAYSL